MMVTPVRQDPKVFLMAQEIVVKRAQDMKDNLKALREARANPVEKAPVKS